MKNSDVKKRLRDVASLLATWPDHISVLGVEVTDSLSGLPDQPSVHVNLDTFEGLFSGCQATVLCAWTDTNDLLYSDKGGVSVYTLRRRDKAALTLAIETIGGAG